MNTCSVFRRQHCFIERSPHYINNRIVGATSLHLLVSLAFHAQIMEAINISDGEPAKFILAFVTSGEETQVCSERGKESSLSGKIKKCLRCIVGKVRDQMHIDQLIDLGITSKFST